MTRPIVRDRIYRRRRFDAEIIELCVRWYITYRLSYRDLVAMMAERGIVVFRTTIHRWVIRYVSEFEKRWNRFARPVNNSWRVDETYIRIGDKSNYLYRAVDRHGSILANIYLHFSLDLWFERKFKQQIHGEAYLVRFVDDFVVSFQYQADAEEFQRQLRERFARFNLFPAILNSWEREVLRVEATRSGFSYWYRNPDHACQESLGVPYEDRSRRRATVSWEVSFRKY